MIKRLIIGGIIMAFISTGPVTQRTTYNPNKGISKGAKLAQVGGSGYVTYPNNTTLTSQVGGSGYVTYPRDGGYLDGGMSEYEMYLQQLEAERQKRIDAIKNAIRAQVEQMVNDYEGQRAEIRQNYQALKNQSELERFKQGKMLRESLANRGALDSGVGRQEQLALQNNYGNALNLINMAEQRDMNELNRAIANVRAQGRMQEALAEADAVGDFSTALQQGYQNYGDSANYRGALGGIRKATKGGSAVTSSSGIGLDRTMSTINNALLNSRTALQKQISDIYSRRLNKDDLEKLNRGLTR
jgi:hypothetical protein